MYVYKAAKGVGVLIVRVARLTQGSTRFKSNYAMLDTPYKSPVMSKE